MWETTLTSWVYSHGWKTWSPQGSLQQTAGCTCQQQQTIVGQKTMKKHSEMVTTQSTWSNVTTHMASNVPKSVTTHVMQDRNPMSKLTSTHAFTEMSTTVDWWTMYQRMTICFAHYFQHERVFISLCNVAMSPWIRARKVPRMYFWVFMMNKVPHFSMIGRFFVYLNLNYRPQAQMNTWKDQRCVYYGKDMKTLWPSKIFVLLFTIRKYFNGYGDNMKLANHYIQRLCGLYVAFPKFFRKKLHSHS